MVFLLSGCKDITDTFKAGNFGKSPQETAMVEAITEKYGDLTKDGDPRFLEAMVSSNVDSFIPVDIVSKYSVNTEKLYAWFVYDNFYEAEVETEWIYLDDNYSIHTFKSTTGEDFGRGSFILEKPDDGWVTGKYQVVIRGNGIQETVPFEIINGVTVSVPLPFVNGKIKLVSTVTTTPAPIKTTAPVASPSPSTTAKPTSTPAVAPGWYFTRWEYVPSSSDHELVGVIQRGGGLFDTSEGEGEKNDFTVSLSRKDAKGNGVASGSCSFIWTDSPEFLAADQKAFFTLNRHGESFWGIGQTMASFDMEDINPGYGTAGKIGFVFSDGKTYFSGNYDGKLETEKVLPKGSKPGDKKAIIINLSNGYGYKYYYEWRE
jgi:hypothetical protein